MQRGQEIFLITTGNQKWQGAAPNLIKRAKRIRRELILVIKGDKNIDLEKAPSKSKPDPMA